MRTRRSFLGLSVSALLATALPLPALADDDDWIVSYLWSRTLARVVAHRRLVADTLGPEIGRQLLVVLGAQGQWGLVDESATTQAAASKLATERHRKLIAVVGGSDRLAAPMANRGYALLHHVGYGLLTGEGEAKARQELVGRLLGPEVKASLGLQVSPEGWQPVYRRFGDAAATELVAQKHAALLRKHEVPAQLVPDRYYDPRWGVAVVAVAKATVVEAVEPAVTEPPSATAAAEVPSAPAPEIQEQSDAGIARVEPVDKGELPAPETSPPPAPAKDPLELPASSGTALRERINDYIQDLRRKRVIAEDETTSWYVQTLHDDRTWAAINAERSLQCASMVKPYVALAFLHRVQEGRIVYGPTSRTKLEAMIEYSSNTATNWAINTLGGPAAVQRILSQHYGHLLAETSITETIPRSGRTYKNRSSARDYVRFSRALWKGELPQSAEIKRLMSLPGRDRLYTGAPDIPKCTQVMNKTGTTAQLCGDFGILVAQTRQGKSIPYAIVGIIEKSCPAQGYSDWVASRTRVIRGVSNLTYQALKEHYRLV